MASIVLPLASSNINGKTSLQEAEKIVHLAKINHIDCIDTAIAYGDSESVLGRLRIKDFKLIITTWKVNSFNFLSNFTLLLAG